MIKEILECCDCGHEYTNDEAKRIPDPSWSKAKFCVCPKCECPDFYINEVQDD